MIELGNKPPLGLDGDVEEPIDRRRVSIRWLAATVLAAIFGAGLMGGAVWAALDGEYRFAQLPEFVRIALRHAGERASNIARQSDRMTLLADHSIARQTLRVSTTTRVADREIAMRVSEFGPQNFIYHEGSRYVINRVILPVSEAADPQTGRTLITTSAISRRVPSNTCQRLSPSRPYSPTRRLRHD